MKDNVGWSLFFKNKKPPQQNTVKPQDTPFLIIRLTHITFFSVLETYVNKDIF